ncbi:MAG: hypothetical protein KBG92_11570 [Spirochaetes bacterium]|nr:hypothetical protein [Spirochaetota bacterium]
MKHSADVITHRFKSSINTLALYALEHELSNDLIASEIDKRFNNVKSIKKDKIMQDVLQSCYKLVWNVNNPFEAGFATKKIQNDYRECLNNCDVMIIARCIINVLKNTNQKPKKNERLSADFYSQCVNSLLSNPLLQYDSDLLTIYCKQTVIILKVAGIINENKIMEINSDDLYRQMFLAFWNKCNWKSLFPSGGYISNEIKNSRQLLLDIIVNTNKSVQLDEVAQTFFELTGIAKYNDLFAVSLLDFSVITWLSFFGIIRYTENSFDKPVTIALTQHAFPLLQFLLC